MAADVTLDLLMVDANMYSKDSELPTVLPELLRPRPQPVQSIISRQDCCALLHGLSTWACALCWYAGQQGRVKFWSNHCGKRCLSPLMCRVSTQ